jgi:hypothetical protein
MESAESYGQYSGLSAVHLLPDELLMHIFRFLDARDLAAGAAAVCSGWRALALEDILWRRLYRRRWPGRLPVELVRVLGRSVGASRAAAKAVLRGSSPSPASPSSSGTDAREFVALAAAVAAESDTDADSGSWEWSDPRFQQEYLDMVAAEERLLASRTPYGARMVAQQLIRQQQQQQQQQLLLRMPPHPLLAPARSLALPSQNIGQPQSQSVLRLAERARPPQNTAADIFSDDDESGAENQNPIMIGGIDEAVIEDSANVVVDDDDDDDDDDDTFKLPTEDVPVGARWADEFRSRFLVENDWERLHVRRVGELGGHRLPVSCVRAFDGCVATASLDGVVRVWRDMQSVRLYQGHTDWVNSVDASDDAWPHMRVLSCGYDKTLRLWGGPEAHVLAGHRNIVWGCRFLGRAGDAAVSCSSDGTLRTWDLETLGERDGWEAHGGRPVYCVSVSRDGRSVVSGGLDGTVAVWDLRCGAGVGPAVRFVGHTDGVSCLHYEPGLASVSSGSRDLTVRLWDLRAGHGRDGCLQVLSGHRGRVYSVQFDHDKVISGSDDNTVKVWSLGGELRATLVMSSWVNGLYFNESTLAVACEKSVLLYNVFRGNLGRPGQPSPRPHLIDLSGGGDAAGFPQPKAAASASRRQRSTSSTTASQAASQAASRGPLRDWSRSTAPAPERDERGGDAHGGAAALPMYPLTASACRAAFRDAVGCRAGGIDDWAAAAARRPSAAAGDRAVSVAGGGGISGLASGVGGIPRRSSGGSIVGADVQRSSWLAIPSLLTAPAIHVDSHNRMVMSAPPVAVLLRGWPQHDDVLGKRKCAPAAANVDAVDASAVADVPCANAAMPNLVDARCILQ